MQQVCVWLQNSWGDFGPWKSGRCLYDLNAIYGRGKMPDAVIFRSSTDDPEEPNAPPTYKP